jgi:hypothetical protein
VYDIVDDWKSAKCDTRNMFILEDGSSPVTINDYPEKAKAFLREMQDIGVNISTCAAAFNGI